MMQPIRRLSNIIGSVWLAAIVAGCSTAAHEPAPPGFQQKLAVLLEQTHFDYQQSQLDNGMIVITVPDHRAPAVYHMVVYPYGAVDEPAGKSGIAHLLEHLMFKATTTQKSGAFSEMIARLGGTQNAFTGMDYTGYHQHIAKQHLGLMMQMEADRMVNLVITKDDVATERAIVLEERRMRAETSPWPKLQIKMSAALYNDHPYGIPVIGWKDEIAALTLEDAERFYQKHYGPDHAILVVSGDVTHGEVMAQAQRTYGKVKARNTAAPVRVAQSISDKPSQVMIKMQDPAASPEGYIMRCAVPPQVTDVADTARLRQQIGTDLMTFALGGGPSGRLYIAANGSGRPQIIQASAGHDDFKRGPGEFRILMLGLPGVPPAHLAAITGNLLQQIKKQGFTERELARAKTLYLASMVHARDSAADLGTSLASTLASGIPLAVRDAVVSQLKAATAEDMNDAIVRITTGASCAHGYMERGE